MFGSICEQLDCISQLRPDLARELLFSAELLSLASRVLDQRAKCFQCLSCRWRPTLTGVCAITFDGYLRELNF